MFALDLFNNDHERRLAEGAVDQLEQRRIDDLAMKMDDLVARAKQATTPEHKAALVKEFQKCKAERDSYFKIKDECMGYGGLVGEGDDQWAQLRKDAEADLSQRDARIAQKPTPSKSFLQQVGDKQIGMVKGAWKGLTSETGIPGNVPVEKIPGKEDLLKGRGRNYYEDQKKNSEPVDEYISMSSDKNYQEAEPYKNYKIYVRRKPFNGMYTAHTEIDRKEFKEPGASQEEAVQAIRDRIDFVLNAQKKVTGSSTIDFNVKFATDLLADPRQTFYAKLENINGEPKLIIASADVASDPELLAAGDFKRSALRNQVDDSGRATPLPGIPLTAKGLRSGDWIANGRYTVGKETQDRDGNRVFDLTYHSTAHTKSDKLRLNQPAFTLGTAREVDEHGGGIGPRQHWQDLMQETVENVRAGMAEIYRRRAPKIERHRDSFLAGQLYDELENYAELHGAEREFKQMMNGARNRAHMEYDTNPGGFQNWFWFLPFEDDDVDEAISKKDLVGRLQKDLPKVNDPKNKHAKPVNWTGPGKDDYGYTGYQGHGMPTDKQERDRIRADKKKGVVEGWSDAMVARRTGQPRTPYSVYIKGKKWKDFENDDHAEAVANKLRAKFKAEGRDPSVITIAPTDIPEGVAETALNPQDIKGDYEAKRRALHDLSLNKDVDQQAVLQRRLDLDREAKSKGITEGVPQELINRYLAIDAENDVDAVRAAIQSISKDPALGANSKSRLLGQIGMIIKRHRLPIGRSYYTYMQQYMEEQYVEEGLMKEPANQKEYLDQRDKLFRMMSMESNPANKQIIKQAIKDLESRFGSATNIREESSTDSEAVERAILNRIMVAHTDLLMKFGPEKVMQAAEEVAYNVGDVDEIGTSDVSAYVNQVKQILGVPEELDEKWSQKYKSSINCANPKGFSQKAHCAGKKK